MLYQAPAVNFLIDSIQTESMQINPSVITLFGKPLPLMLMTYIGSIKVIWHIVVFWLMGISVETARIGSVILGVFSLIYTFLFIRRLFPDWVALLTVFLMAASAEFVFYTSRDMTIVFMLLAKMAALYHFVQYAKTLKVFHLLIGAIALGLGLYDKASFLWFIITLILYVVLFQRKLIFSIPLRHYATALCGFLLSGIVFFIFNIIRLGETFAPLITDFNKTSGGIDNTSFLMNLWTRFEQLFSLLNGDGLLVLYTQTPMDNVLLSILPWSIVIPVIITISMIFMKSFFMQRKKIIFAAFFFLTPLLQTTFTPSSLSLHHIAIVWPFHIILFSIFVFIVFSILKNQKAKLIFVMLPVVVISLNVYSVFSLYRGIKDKGSAGNWSETIYELNDYLIEQNETTFLMTWGFTNNLIVTSKGRLTMIRLYRDFIKADLLQRRELIRNNLAQNRLYLFSANQANYQETDEMFMDESKIMGFVPVTEKIFYQKNGYPIYYVYSIRKI
jgi:4-amino-4-deoxy-L-arabinose transferase-like glycosyltransferase